MPTRLNARMSAGKAIAGAAKAAARNNVVRGLAASAGAAAAKQFVPTAHERYGSWRDRRVHRDRAIKLARQMGGRYSQDTIIDGELHFVVWKDSAPVRAFPHVEELAARPELQGFDERLVHEPPSERQLPRPLRRDK